MHTQLLDYYRELINNRFQSGFRKGHTVTALVHVSKDIRTYID